MSYGCEVWVCQEKHTSKMNDVGMRYLGNNMPFKYRNKFQMTLLHTLFWGSGLAAPMLLIRYILWRKRQA
uniref:Cytochrome c oxidase polypeptide VIIc n=1 Tax=Timema cristinae TaxID=61476 RepID=A0A7R9H736_TIMCR|nr:unnamed protein product [Timema cristinae]